MQDLVSVKQASQSLKLSRGFLYKLPQGTPGVYRLGRTVRFSIDELLTALRRPVLTEGASNDC